MIACLQHDEYSWVREKAATALGKLGDRQAIDPLIAALAEESPNNRTAALTALQAITGEKLGEDRAGMAGLVEGASEGVNRHSLLLRPIP